jgi:O-antigen/teichoic acid export membrane protein
MSRTHRFVQGFVSGYAHLIAATAAGLWLTPFFLERLGQTSYGLWLVGTQVLAYLLLMDFGIVALLPRETAYVTGRTGRHDAPELRALVEKTFTLAVLQTPAVLAAASLALWWLPQPWTALRVPLAVALALFVVTFPFRVFQAALTGLQDLAFVARVQFAAWGAGTAVTVWLVLQGLGLPALAAGWCVTHVVIVASCGLRLATGFPEVMPRRLAFRDVASVRGYLARSAWVSVSQVSQALLNGTDVMIIGALLGPAAVVPYACTGKLITVLANQPQAILQSAAPALSELRSSGNHRRLFQVSAALSQTTLAFSGLLACVVLAVNGGFVTWWVGAGQFGGLGLTTLLLAAMLIRHFNTTNVYALFSFGLERRVALTGLADGIVTIALSLGLVQLFGVAGAAAGGIVGVLLVSVPLNLSALSRETAVAPGRLVATLGPWLWRFLLVAAVVGLSGGLARTSSFPALAAIGTAAGLLYTFAVAGPILRSPAGGYLRPRLDRVSASVPFRISRKPDRHVSATSQVPS